MELLTNNLGEILATALIGLVTFLFSRFKSLEAYKATFADGVKFAYTATSEVARRTATKVDDKVAVALGKLSDFLGRPLTPEETAKAKVAFDALHYEEKKSGVVVPK